MEKHKKMIILSLDAVGSRDLEYMKTLPNFRAHYDRSAVCEQVNSVYPSLTYPAHTSIVTGRLPVNHGIVNNLQIQPEREPSDWLWHRSFVKGTTLYDEAMKKGMKTAALLWPVMAKARVNYNLPEVLPNRWWQNQLLVSFLSGTPRYELALQQKFGQLRDGIHQPQLDNFVHESMLYTLKKYRPDLMLVHLTDVDTNRHNYGVDHPIVKEALNRHDRRLGELTDALKELGLYEDTDLVVLGDHCQMDVQYAVYPNFYFREKGYLTIRDNQVVDWKVIARDCDGSCYVYIKDASLYEEVKSLLEQLMQDETKGILTIFNTAQAAALGADGTCAFMLEARPGYYFQNGFSQEISNVLVQAATHGYLPDQEGYRTIFLAAGPDFLAGASVDRMSLIDEGPTLAKVLGLDLGDTDGAVITKLLQIG